MDDEIQIKKRKKTFKFLHYYTHLQLKQRSAATPIVWAEQQSVQKANSTRELQLVHLLHVTLSL
jgi:hypothetical protein